MHSQVVPLSKILTVSRLRSRGTCTRADHLRHDEELHRADVVVPAEPLVRGSVIHAGLAVACAGWPAPADADAVTAACIAEAVAQGLGATDPRLPAWARVASRAARAAGGDEWRAVRAPTGADVASAEVGRVDGAAPAVDATTGPTLRRSHDGHHVTVDLPAQSAQSAPSAGSAPIVEVRMCVRLPDGDPAYGDLARGWWFSFKPDALLEHIRTGRTWLWDHKTKSEIARVEPWAELHLQALLYVRALRASGIEVAGAVLYTVLADEPSTPSLRKDGHLKDIMWATDWPTAEAVIRTSTDPDPDSPRYDRLRAAIAERRWQLPQEVMFSDEELERAWDHLLDARDDLVRARAYEMKKALDLHLPVWRAVHPSGRGHACASCDFREWCAEDFAGRDPEALVGSTYQRGADKYLAEVSLTPDRTALGYRRSEELNGIDKHRARP